VAVPRPLSTLPLKTVDPGPLIGSEFAILLDTSIKGSLCMVSSSDSSSLSRDIGDKTPGNGNKL